MGKRIRINNYNINIHEQRECSTELNQPRSKKIIFFGIFKKWREELSGKHDSLYTEYGEPDKGMV